jgi:hypothetical protein
MIKPLLATIGGLAVAGFMFTGTANAACWWNGYNWDCNYAPAYEPYYNPYPYSPYGWIYPYYPGYGYYYGRYPGPKTNSGGY